MIDLVKNLALVNRLTKSSVIRELLKLTNQPDMISFAGGLPDPATFPVEMIEDIVHTVMKDKASLALQYGPTGGIDELKDEIIKHFRQFNQIEIKRSNILITTASQQGLYLVGKTFIDPQDPVLVELPSYIGGLQVFSSYRARLIGIKSDNDGMLVTEVEAQLQKLQQEGEHQKFIYVVPDFQNPSGLTMTQERRKELVAVAQKYSVFIVEDSPYRDIRFQGTSPDLIYKLDGNGQGGGVISLFTFSKTFAPGFRLGFVVAPDDVINKFSTLKQSLDLCSSPFNQYIVAEFLRRGVYEDHLQKVIGIYRKKCRVMLEALEHYMPKAPGISWTKPDGGLFLWLRLPENINTEEMFMEAINQKVAYVIGSAFHCDNKGHNTMRLNFSYPSESEIDEGIKRLSKVVENRLKKA